MRAVLFTGVLYSAMLLFFHQPWFEYDLGDGQSPSYYSPYIAWCRVDTATAQLCANEQFSRTLLCWESPYCQKLVPSEHVSRISERNGLLRRTWKKVFEPLNSARPLNSASQWAEWFLGFSPFLAIMSMLFMLVLQHQNIALVLIPMSAFVGHSLFYLSMLVDENPCSIYDTFLAMHLAFLFEMAVLWRFIGNSARARDTFFYTIDNFYALLSVYGVLIGIGLFWWIMFWLGNYNHSRGLAVGLLICSGVFLCILSSVLVTEKKVGSPYAMAVFVIVAAIIFSGSAYVLMKVWGNFYFKQFFWHFPLPMVFVFFFFFGDLLAMALISIFPNLVRIVLEQPHFRKAWSGGVRLCFLTSSPWTSWSVE